MLVGRHVERYDFDSAGAPFAFCAIAGIQPRDQSSPLTLGALPWPASKRVVRSAMGRCPASSEIRRGRSALAGMARRDPADGAVREGPGRVPVGRVLLDPALAVVALQYLRRDIRLVRAERCASQADSHLGRSPSATDHWMGVGQIWWSVWLLLDRFRFCECRQLALQALHSTATPALSQGP